MKTGKTELPRSKSGADEFFILRGKKQEVRIIGDGYVLRELSFSDCESFAENANNTKIWNNLMDHFPHPYTKQDAFDYISMVKAMPGMPMRFAIEVDGVAVGSIGFGSEGDVERVTAEVGYWIGEKYWGHGIVHKVLEDITEYAFRYFHYEKLYAIVFSSNPPSMHVLERAGYQQEAVLHHAAVKNGKLVDFCYFCRMREDVKLD
ncbi:MAG: GNAT family protein [Odoribacter sp.]